MSNFKDFKRMNNMENDWSELVTTFWVRSDDVNIGDVVVLELIDIPVHFIRSRSLISPQHFFVSHLFKSVTYLRAFLIQVIYLYYSNKRRVSYL